MIKGAEATIEIEENRVVKKREPKKYRNSELDERLREERTETEARLIKEAKKYNVKVPEVEKTDESTIEMEKIDGEPLKHFLSDNLEKMREVGENVAYLHKADIIHGDLTTSNTLLEEEIYLIDFGLAFRSQRNEDKAVDIHLLKQVLNSSHPEVSEEAWEKFTEGYKSYKRSEEVLEQLEDVESRGRYK